MPDFEPDFVEPERVDFFAVDFLAEDFFEEPLLLRDADDWLAPDFFVDFFDVFFVDFVVDFFDDAFFDDDLFDDFDPDFLLLAPDFLLEPDLELLVFDDDDLRDDDFGGGGTLPPSSRASDSAIAMACLRLFTFCPEPLRNFPRFNSCIFSSTFSCDF